MFSVIISTYNGSKNIIDTIENIRGSIKKFDYEILIINDGSTDNTKELLETYKDSAQFKIFNQPNKGISASRNRGIKHLSDKSDYVVFIDDSDKVEKNFFRKIDDFFKKNNSIDIVAIPLIRTNKELIHHHSLNYRFHSNIDIVNIHKDYKYIHFHIGGLAFRKKIFKNEHYRFDEKMHFWEDAKFINNLLIDKEKYGLIKDTAYLYNSENPNSLSKSAWALEERYKPLLEINYMQLINKSNEKFGKTIKYVQFLIGTHFIEYLKEHNQEKILKSLSFEKDEFEKSSKNLFKNIDSNIIYDLKTSYLHKSYMLNLKEEQLSTSKFTDHFSVFIHSYDFINRKITFTFSKETCSIPIDSEVYIEYMDNKLKKASLIKEQSLKILGKSFSDFSKNVYQVKLPFISIFIESRMLIVSNDMTYIITNPSIMNRVLKNIIKKSSEEAN